MAHSRSLSTTEALKDPHFVSLKVLRLSRPSFVEQSLFVNPKDDSLPNLPPSAGLAYPSADAKDGFQLSPLLSLPPGFGRVSIGETLSCIICANNELLKTEKGRVLGSFQLAVDVVNPKQQTVLLLAEEDEASEVTPGESLERIVNFDLTEEGSHELRVTIKYTETVVSATEKDEAIANERIRSFRKIYKFMSQPCLMIRTKTRPYSRQPATENSGTHPMKFVLEAQLENVGGGNLVIESANLETTPPFKSISLNWESHRRQGVIERSPLIKPHQILQIAFVIEQKEDAAGLAQMPGKELIEANGIIIGRIKTRWRTPMGDPGQLTTGWLSTKSP